MAETFLQKEEAAKAVSARCLFLIVVQQAALAGMSN